MRLAFAVICWAAIASANPMARKLLPPNVPTETLRSFSHAAVLEREGRLEEARDQYRAANNITPSASAYWNMAALSITLERPREAIDALRKYIELASEDKAAAEKIIASLQTVIAPRTLGARDHANYDPRTLILVDGVVIGPAPATIHPTVGKHYVERISTKFYWSQDFRSTPGESSEYVGIGGYETNVSGTGNVIIDGALPGGNVGREWTEGSVRYVGNKRFPLPLGHYKTGGPREGHEEHPHFCSPIEFDVKATNEITYVHVIWTGDTVRDECVTVKRVTVQRLLQGAL